MLNTAGEAGEAGEAGDVFSRPSYAESDESVAVAELVVWDSISDLGSNILCVLFIQQDHRTI